LPVLTLSSIFNDEENELLRDLAALFSHYTYFPVDDQTGLQYSQIEAYDRHCQRLARLQRTSLKHFKEKLTVLALSNYASIDKRSELEGLLEPLTTDELTELANLLDLRTAYPDAESLKPDRKILMEALLSTFEKHNSFQDTARSLSNLPDETTLFEHSLMRTDHYDGSRPLALPKLNLQYLSVGDFLWRALILFRCESFYGIRRDIEDVVRRLQPENKRPGETSFGGFSKMALPIGKPA
jgi:intron-binding protein aquarius